MTLSSRSTHDAELNNFATRSFRETADCDYIAARLSYRAQLIPQFLWQSLQAIEKYFKCILVLNRIRARKSHNLHELLQDISDSAKFVVRMSQETTDFLEYVDTYGRFRYYEVPYYVRGDELFRLDRAVWEIRRYARPIDFEISMIDGRRVPLLQPELDHNARAESRPPQEFAIVGGHLEKVLDTQDHPSRSGLTWHNLFFGKSRRTSVMHRRRVVAGNAPLSLRPELLEEVLKYVYLPSDVIEHYRKRVSSSQ